MTVTTVEGERFTGQGFELLVVEGAGAVAQVIANNAEQHSGWQLILGLDPSSPAAMREGTLPLFFQPASTEYPLGAEPGTGTLTWHDNEQFVAATEGTVSFALHEDGTMAGEVNATGTLAQLFDGTMITDSEFLDPSATFASELVVISCWVYPESLGEAPNGTGDGVGGGQIADANFSSEFCQPFAALQ